jgi:hypothetical protein
MDSGHLSVKGFSVDQLQHLPTHGTLTEVLEERSSEVPSFKKAPKGQRVGDIRRPTVSHKRLAKKQTWWDKTVSNTSSGLRTTFETVGNLATGTVDFFKDNPAEGISMAVDFTPGFSNVKSGFEAIFGFDPITGRELEAWEQALAAAGIVGGPIADSFKHGARGIKHGDDIVDLAKGIDNTSDAVTNLSRAQQRNLDTLDNITNKHLTDKDFSGTLRDLQGNPVPKPSGGYWDHIQEMKDSYNGLIKIRRGLEGSLNNPNLDDATRKVLTDGLDDANKYIKKIEDLFEPFGGI